MASVVEYKGLKAGYYCGYCESREGKASRGECAAVQIAVTGSSQALAMSWQVCSAGEGRWSPDPSFPVSLVSPQPASFPSWSSRLYSHRG